MPPLPDIDASQPPPSPLAPTGTQTNFWKGAVGKRSSYVLHQASIIEAFSMNLEPSLCV
ncbi:uncharacterized protein BJ212DRAFT_1419270 [Suillus subaureus]|uniref:Uncharacterized protein n=1 Tax=Suillus subaureus TaxID=48587 RepID=A0A9P7AKT2_9AGAM|nr:uncharacterized protein BJ212DRAFT_1419270 [Suillus subaureus]KAG1791496.1 hypothetical protein BJ212DRAFT_1419270 [Suillus subaureus]